jgi:hypothetical protein
MELGGSVYLYALAALGMTFATTVAIFVVLRHASGAPFSPGQTYAIEVLMERGFLVAGLAILPMLIGIFDMSHSIVWRISSGIVFAFFIPYWWISPGRRRHIAQASAPLFMRIFWVVDWVLTIWLLANSIGVPFPPGPGPYAVAVTFLLAQTCFAFLQRLLDFLGRGGPLSSQGQ